MKKIMKTMAVVAGAVLMLSACSEEKQIVGKWEVTHNITQQEYTADNVLQEFQLDKIYTDTTYVNNELGFVYEFKDDHVGTITPTTESGLNGMEFYYYFEEGEQDDIVIVGNTTDEWEIEKLTHQKMILVLDVNQHNNVANGTTLPHTEKRYQRLELERIN